MNSEIKKIIEDRLQKIPNGVLSILDSVNMTSIIKNISEANKFDLATENSFAIEVLILILGIESPEKFQLNLSKNVGLTDEVVDKIIDELEQKLLTPILNLNKDNKISISDWYKMFFQDHKVSAEDMLDKSNIYEQTMQVARLKTRDVLPLYIESLKNEVVDSVLDPVWAERVGEISKKYSLGDDQARRLSQNVFFALVGLQNPEQLAENVSKDLGISKIITEQIILDVENRIFNHLAKQKIPKRENKSESLVTKEFSIEKPIAQINQEKLLGESVSKSRPVIENTPNYSSNTVILEKEVVQSPVPTPKFKAVPMSDIESGQDFIPNLAPKPNAGGIMETKLNSVPKATEPVKKSTLEHYTVDPYREPLN